MHLFFMKLVFICIFHMLLQSLAHHSYAWINWYCWGNMPFSCKIIWMFVFLDIVLLGSFVRWKCFCRFKSSLSTIFKTEYSEELRHIIKYSIKDLLPIKNTKYWKFGLTLTKKWVKLESSFFLLKNGLNGYEKMDFLTYERV